MFYLTIGYAICRGCRVFLFKSYMCVRVIAIKYHRHLRHSKKYMNLNEKNSRRSIGETCGAGPCLRRCVKGTQLAIFSQIYRDIGGCDCV